MVAPNTKILHDYLKAYSDADYERVAQFYHPDISVLLPNGITHENRSSFLESLRQVHIKLKETLVPRVVLVDGLTSFVMMDVFFEALDYTPGLFFGLPETGIESGDVVRLTVWAFYRWENGKISSIECLTRCSSVMKAAVADIQQLLAEARAM